MSFSQLWLRLLDLPGFIGSMIAVLAIWVLSAIAWLAPIDHLYYDFVVGAIPQPLVASHQVLLVETVPGATHDWPRLSGQLLKAGARQLVFILPLNDADLRALAASGHADKVLIGRALLAHEASTVRHMAAIPPDLADKLRFGIATIPENEAGSHRSQLSTYRSGQRDLPGIETLAAMSAGQPAPPDWFMPNFHDGVELPRINAVRLETEGALAQLVSGKTVMIGYAASSELAQFTAPGLPLGKLLTKLEFHGLATDSLLQNKLVTTHNLLAKALLVLLLGFALVIVFQPLRLISAFWVVLSLEAGIGLLAWVLLRFFNHWPPVPELFLMVALSFIAVYRAKARANGQRLRKLFSETSGKLENRLQPSAFAESLEHWLFVINLVDQIMDLDHTIFLERIPNDDRVREIQALRCSINDISEVRRDYRRYPYTDAIERRGVIEIDMQRRPYLKAQSPDERQFLTPLIFGGEVFGFWAFALNAKKIRNIESVRESAGDIADGIGHLLYQRQLRIKRKQFQTQPWQRYIDNDAIHLYQNVSQAVSALERRVTSLEQMFAGLSTAAVVFDLFGRLTLINNFMSHLLTEAGIAPYEMTAVSLLEKLTGCGADNARLQIQTLFTDTTPLLMSTKLPGKAPGRFILHLRSLKNSVENNDTASPFRIHDLLLELIDGAELHRLYGARFELVQHLSHQLNNDLATVMGALQLVKAVPAKAEEMLSVIDIQVHSAAETLGRVQGLLEQEVSIDFRGQYPIDPGMSLQNAMESLRAAATEREITLSLQMRATPFLVYSNARELEHTLRIFLQFLLDDAVQGSELTVAVKVGIDQAEFEFKNTGFGIPQERLDRILAGTIVSDNAMFESLRQALLRIETWGGSSKFRSDIGEGFSLTLILRTF